jgi:pimeloyl-ACP methyl ester carboxylesterase
VSDDRSGHGDAGAIREAALGPFPCLSAGSGRPLVILAGLFPEAGVAPGPFRRLHEGMLAGWTENREVFYINRRPGLPAGMSFAELAAEHAAALREHFAEPVDLLGMSTGGSLAQQLAAEHPDVIRKLVLVSTGARLGERAKLDQRRVAARVRAGAVRRAGAVMGAALADGDHHARQLAAAVAGWLLTPRICSAQGLSDMATTIEAEDSFDLAGLPQVVAATRLIGGGRDVFYPVALLEETVALIPGCQLELRDDAGHVDVLARPGVIAGALGFLDDPAAPGG